MKRLISLSILFFSCCTLLFSQGGTTVTGRITDDKGLAVEGAVVMIENVQGAGAVTDKEGRYSLNVPDVQNPVLVFSCIGYKTYKTGVAGRKVINALLEEENEELEEVVVVGYGSMRRSDLTGSVTSVKIDEGDAARSESIDRLLQGKAAGMQVTSNGGSPDGGVSINIRGLSSFNGDSQPLFVIDGIILNTSSPTEELTSQDSGSYNEETNGLLGLNPNDIESIEILKDASATAIYGALGANGVVLITTRTARREQPSVQASASVSVGRIAKHMDVMSFDDYVDYLSVRAPSYLSRIYSDPEDRSTLLVTPIDWQDYVTRTAVSRKYYVSVSGKPKSFSYLFSFGYSGQQGVIRGTDLDQYTSRINIDKNFTKNFRTGVKMNFAAIKSDMTQGTSTNSLGAATSMVRSMLMYVPYVGGADVDVEEDEDLRSGPNRWLTDYINKRTEYRITPSVYAQYKLSDVFTFKSTFGGDYRATDRGVFKTSRINRQPTGSLGALSFSEYLSYNFDNTLMFNRKFFGGHRISGTVGVSSRRITSETEIMEGWNVEQYKALADALNGAPNTRIRLTRSASSTLSGFVRAIYNYKERYVLTSTFRADGSSRFAKGNKWAYFPSFAFAWRLAEEPWFRVPSVSSAKFRLGWGQVGNQAVSNYQTLSTYGSGRLATHIPGDTSGGVVTIYPSNLANPDLKWETTEQYNTGLDIGLWKGRLTLAVDAYYKFTRDLLQQKRVAVSSGVSKIWVNEGNISNRGLEMSLTAVPVKTSDLELSMHGNISLNRNRIESISEDAAKDDIYITKDKLIQAVYFLGATVGSGSIADYPANIFIEGQPMGLFYGLATDGIVQSGETGTPFSIGGSPTAPGSINYLDLNGDGVISEKDRTIIGNPNPKFIYGFGFDLTWKRVTLQASFTGSYGNDILNVNNIYENDLSYYYNNHRVTPWKNAWTEENPSNRWPGVMQGTVNDRLYISDRAVEDGSYLRLSSLSLSWNVPVSKKSAFFKSASVSVAASNLFVLTKYSGWDPDVNSYGSNINKMGLDVGSYPSSRRCSVNVKLSF